MIEGVLICFANSIVGTDEVELLTHAGFQLTS